ncbi:macrophage mannose receptor 1-like [Megalobrama amblycephala]|uniref:macrophage mannose receptor 1-like n=1 Tax=Megalobrama amblycephala TaxID=75352 RepID=UPI0020141022|nr:macrophage mannose receptor 1-like [Megalobrama amblycephala]
MNVYYFVPELKTFVEAQQYCRETYTDLATIESMDDLSLLATGQVTSSGAWIGLMKGSTFYWNWALSDGRFYREGEREYRNWAPFKPDTIYYQDCVIMTYKGQFENTNCLNTFNFICFDANNIEQQYFYISFLYTWREAQRYCRRYHTDLVSVRNQGENQEIQQLIPTEGSAYIGLFKDSYIWSDNSGSSFRNWDSFQPGLIGDCVALVEERFWKTMLCSRQKPFFCYHIHMKRQILRLEVKSGLNVNDPDIKTAILTEIEQKLQKLGVMANITRLEWREAADGTVFQKNQNKISVEQMKKKR